MDTGQAPLKWKSDETNLFCEILADPVSNFMETLEKRSLKKLLQIKYLIPLLEKNSKKQI